MQLASDQAIMAKDIVIALLTMLSHVIHENETPMQVLKTDAGSKKLILVIYFITKPDQSD